MVKTACVTREPATSYQYAFNFLHLQCLSLSDRMPECRRSDVLLILLLLLILLSYLCDYSEDGGNRVWMSQVPHLIITPEKSAFCSVLLYDIILCSAHLADTCHHWHWPAIAYSAGDMFATPELMRLVMRKKPDVLTALTSDDKLHLLGYLLADCQYGQMDGEYPLSYQHVWPNNLIIWPWTNYLAVEPATLTLNRWLWPWTDDIDHSIWPSSFVCLIIYYDMVSYIEFECAVLNGFVGKTTSSMSTFCVLLLLWDFIALVRVSM